MELPVSTQALTKQLRSKDITTAKICDIYSKLNEEEYYFPNKEIFAIELIQDRWNDQKLTNFKTDPKIWALYNKMWIELNDDDLTLKKLFKQLKFVPHLIKSLELVEDDAFEFAKELKLTCEMVNSITTMNVTIENAIVIMGHTLNFVVRLLKINDTSDLICALIEQIKNLTGIMYAFEINSKLANVYCNELLLPSIQYLSRSNESNKEDPVNSFLVEQLGVFLFGNSIDTTKQLENFVKRNRTQLNSDIAFVLFDKSISFLSKQNFAELEKIFTMIIEVQPQLTRQLLQQLAVSKKTMSNEFLTDILNKSLEMAADHDLRDSNFWALLSHLLELDIEIGIKNLNIFINLIYENRNKNFDDGIFIWKKVIQCFINAREFPNFLENFEEYCRKNIDIASFFLRTPAFAGTISSKVSAYSITQLKSAVANHLKIIGENDSNDVSFLVFRTVLHGLQSFPYISLVELKESLSPVFTIDPKSQPHVLELRYLVLSIFDDIIPKELLESWEEKSELSILKEKPSKESFFYFFKLREYKEFDLTAIVLDFMKFFRDINNVDKREIIQLLFTNWSTLVNSYFQRNDISELMDFILLQKDIQLLDELLADDDFFEENNVIGVLVNHLINFHTNPAYISLIRKVPLQCINKNIRIELIDNICGHEFILSETEEYVLDYLLKNPTFKSKIESDFCSLYDFFKKNLVNMKYKDLVFQRIWKNHLSQMKEEKSQIFIREGVEYLSKSMVNKKINNVDFQLGFLVAIYNDRESYTDFRSEFVKKITTTLIEQEFENEQMMSWILRCLYFIFDLDGELKSEINTTLLSSKIIEIYKRTTSANNKTLLVNLFLLYSVLFNDKLEYLFAQYIVLRNYGAESKLMLKAVGGVVDRLLKRGTTEFNDAFSTVIYSLSKCTASFYGALLELYQLQIMRINKDNIIGIKLFALSLSEFYTGFENFQHSRNGVLTILRAVQYLLINKPWLFSQHSIELLFPMCLKVNCIFLNLPEACDDIYIETVKVISNIIFAHRMRISNRHHLINAFVCEYLDILSIYQERRLSSKAANIFARLITSICEPNMTGNQTYKTNDLNSKISVIRKQLRKYVPVILVKYIHLASCAPFRASIRKELLPAMFSIFDLLSQNELVLLNAALDHAGVQYFKSLYSDYRKTGKWNTD